MFAFEKLDVWKIAKSIVVKTYKLTKIFPKDEKFGLVYQLNRAAVSVASNIIEGSGRTSYKDQVYFTQLSYSSLVEVACYLEIAKELKFIEDIHNIYMQGLTQYIGTLVNKLSALRKSQLKRFNSQLQTINSKLKSHDTCQRATS